MAEDWEMERLKFHEGLKLCVYVCPAGKKTIGVGRCLETNPLTAEEKRVCPDAERGITYNGAIYLLRNDIDKCKAQLNKEFNWIFTLDEERQYALLDMCFQLGINGLKKFRKMLLYLKLKDFKKASIECLDSNYAKQTPKRANRIARLIRTGEWVI
ncbi:MAG: glycoside hydrolase family protein [Bacteroidales bacterium]|nr:glycoside hydrolase family protein [Candidatus Scybalousia scybalohippi]